MSSNGCRQHAWENDAGFRNPAILPALLLLVLWRTTERDVSISAPLPGFCNGAWTCSGPWCGPQDMSLQATNSLYPALKPKFLPISSECLRVVMPQALSIIHPGSMVGVLALHQITGVRSELAQPLAPKSWKYQACSLLCRQNSPQMSQQSGTACIRYSSFSSACIFCMNTRSLFSYFIPIRPNSSHRSQSLWLHAGNSMTRWRALNLLPYPSDFPISGGDFPLGAWQNGIGEGKVLVRPKAQQRVSSDQWVSSGIGHMRTWDRITIMHHCLAFIIIPRNKNMCNPCGFILLSAKLNKLP